MPTDKKPSFIAVWKPSTGKLVERGLQYVRVTRPWPAPRSWIQPIDGGEWREAFPVVPHEALAPAGDAPRSGLSSYARARLEAWVTVPQDVRDAVRQIAPIYCAGRALSLIARCPGALDLARSVPLLAGALAVANDVRPKPVHRPLRSARALLRAPDGMRRWRNIAAWLGLGDSRAVVNLVRRSTSARPWSSTDFVALRLAWADPLGRKQLLHADHIDDSVVRLIGAAARHHVCDRLDARLIETAHGQHRLNCLGVRLDALVTGWRMFEGDRPVPMQRTMEGLETTLADLRARTRALYCLDGAEHLDFPPPPLPEAPGIAALATPEALRTEGAELGHCIGTTMWERDARTRSGYGYAIRVGGDRATLWVVPDRARSGRFVVSQLQGPGNTPPSLKIAAAVIGWLRSQPGQPPAEWTEELSLPPPIAEIPALPEHLLYDRGEIPF